MYQGDTVSHSELEDVRRRNDPAAKAEPRRSELTRRAILDAALEFLWSRPFRDLTIAELMSDVGIARQTFYRYFADLHDLMENLLRELQEEFQGVAGSWLAAEGDPVPKLAEALAGVVRVSYRRGPLIRAVVEAAPLDDRLDRAWNDFVKVFDDAATARIEMDQAAGRVPDFDARLIAVALNRMDIGTLVHHFGRRPRSRPGPVCESLARVWISTIYGEGALARVEGRPGTPRTEED